MECLEMPVWTDFTQKEIESLRIDLPDSKIHQKVLHNWDMVAKPLDGLGKFEKIIAKIGAITHTAEINISKKAVIIMCADNGIVAEKISQSGHEVTAAVAAKMALKKSSVGKMANVIGADTIPIDIGINSDKRIEGLIDKRISNGTRNFAIEPAMTECETIKAIYTGIEIVYECKKSGYNILATGEMGIGNTTTSSAIVAALLKCDVSKVTGRGAGLDSAGLLRKQKVIADAIEKYDLTNADTLTVLRTVGGLDIAGLAGVCIGGALFHIPIVLDGVIAMVAGLVAESILPGIKEYLIASHRGKEPAVEYLIRELELEPVIDGSLALGEGTGAVMMMSLLDVALSVYSDMTTFSDIQTPHYIRFLS